MTDFNKNDIQEEDIYIWIQNTGDIVIAEIIKENNKLVLKPIKYVYWKPVYECLKNDYLSIMDAKLIYRKSNYKDMS